MLEKEAKELLALVGGKENVNQLVHCATRLRFELKDDSLVKKEEIESKPYVLSVVNSGGQYQIVIGPKVTDYFAAVMKLLNLEGNKKSESTPGKMSLLKIISGAFSPLIPLLAGSGMIKALRWSLAFCRIPAQPMLFSRLRATQYFTSCPSFWVSHCPSSSAETCTSAVRLALRCLSRPSPV